MKHFELGKIYPIGMNNALSPLNTGWLITSLGQTQNTNEYILDNQHKNEPAFMIMHNKFLDQLQKEKKENPIVQKPEEPKIIKIKH